VPLPVNSGPTAYCSLFYFNKAANFTHLAIRYTNAPVKGTQVSSLTSNIPTGTSLR
jgi:hypothetical protein